ncbi:MAG: serine/threonine-protein phosphatase [Treponema sp.]|nr:serine/threonine-protein phosphatase [Treponema sp.]
MYDYYSYNDILNGISLFDVSGHGLSASLVTMLSKNIISRVFQTGFRRKETVDKILSKINNMILSEKGDIDNYMTGILCRFENEPDSDECTVELGNAGHPYPLKFSAQDNEIFELKGNDGKKHYGAIGMQGITVSFARSNFCMKTGDILVLYTDGITEAVNPRYDQFGLEPIKFIIKQHHDKSPSEILSLIMERLRVFTQEKPLEDDITLIIAKRTDMHDYISDDEHEEELDDSIEELTAE